MRMFLQSALTPERDSAGLLGSNTPSKYLPLADEPVVIVGSA